MAKLNIDPSGAHFLPWAKAKLAQLTALRADLRIPKMTKGFVPSPGTFVHIVSSEFGDSIRITGGVPYGLANFVNSPPTVSYRAVVDSAGKVMKPSRTVIRFTDISSSLRFAYKASGLNRSEASNATGAQLEEGAEVHVSTLVSPPTNPLNAFGEAALPDGTLAEVFAHYNTAPASLDSWRIAHHQLDPAAEEGSRWSEVSTTQIPAEVLALGTGISVFDAAGGSSVPQLKYDLASPFGIGSSIKIQTPVMIHNGFAAASPTGKGIGMVAVSYLTAVTPGTVYDDYDGHVELLPGDPFLAGTLFAHGCWVQVTGKTDVHTFSRDMKTMDAEILDTESLDWGGFFFLTYRYSTGTINRANVSAGGRIFAAVQSPLGVQMALTDSEMVSAHPVNNTPIPSFVSGHHEDAWFVGRVRHSVAGALSVVAGTALNQAPSYLEEFVPNDGNPTATHVLYADKWSVSATNAQKAQLVRSGSTLWTWSVAGAGDPGSGSVSVIGVPGRQPFGDLTGEMFGMRAVYQKATPETRAAVWADGAFSEHLQPGVGGFPAYVLSAAGDGSARIQGWMGTDVKYIADGVEIDTIPTGTTGAADTSVDFKSLAYVNSLATLDTTEHRFAELPEGGYGHTTRVVPLQNTWTYEDQDLTPFSGEFVTPMHVIPTLFRRLFVI